MSNDKRPDLQKGYIDLPPDRLLSLPEIARQLGWSRQMMESVTASAVTLEGKKLVRCLGHARMVLSSEFLDWFRNLE